MAISSYPRTIQNGQIASNGDANAGTGLMLWDSATNTYIAATPSTFQAGGAGGATAANQVIGNDYLSAIVDNTENITNDIRTLIDIFKGITPSLLNAGIPNLGQSNGLQVGNLFVSDNLNIIGRINIVDETTDVSAIVNASGQLKTTAV